MKKVLSRDTIEKLLAVAFTLWMVWRIGNAVLHGDTPLISMMVCVGEIVVLIFLLMRRPTENVAVRPADWALAFGSALLPTLVQPGGDALIPIWIATALFIIVTLAQIATKLSLNRSFGIVPANRGVVTDGFYGLVRHPVYASYLFGHLLFLLINPTLWNLGLYATAWTLQIMRIHAEERLLSEDEAYREYRKAVRYRLLPGLY
jgi:protein-S-isoprenylcysteine O-methyltransferase Ste14